jgi:hypothetical protein
MAKYKPQSKHSWPVAVIDLGLPLNVKESKSIHHAAFE